MAIRLETLGGLRVLKDGGELTRLPRQRLRCALLLFLAMERRVARERLLHLLWPEQEPRRARRALSQMVLELKHDLGTDLVEPKADPFVANEELTTDAADFELLIEGGQFGEAGALYRGPFLGAFHLAGTGEFEKWVDSKQAHFAMLYRDAQARHVGELTSKGDVTGALAAAQRWALAEPLDDEAHRILIELLARSGMRIMALRHYEAYRERLRQTREGAKPPKSLTDFVAAVRQGTVPVDVPHELGAEIAEHLTAGTRIAVLPFASSSGGGAYDYFCEAFAKEIINFLDPLPGLRAMPFDSTSPLARRPDPVGQAVRDLQVTHALTGTIEFSRDRYEVEAELIEGATGRVLWKQAGLEGKLATEDVFEVRDRLVTDVVGSLADRLQPQEDRRGPRRPRTDPVALDLYDRARHAWSTRTRDNMSRALDLFGQAVAREPSFARAYAGIADVYIVWGGFDYSMHPPHEIYPRAHEAAQRALDLEPDLAEAHATMGNYLMSYEWDWKRAEGCFLRALELDPDHSSARQWYSNFLMYVGRADAAVGQARLALELTPDTVFLSSSLARHYQLMRQPEAAAEQFKKATELDGSFVSAQMGLALAELQAGRPEAGLERIESRTAELAALDVQIPLLQALHAYAVGFIGDEERARRLLRKLKATTATYLPPENVALAYIGLGEYGRAIDWLEKAAEARSQLMSFLNVEPIADPLRGEPRFQALLRRIGF